jgi:uncharacterized protein YbjT (DUF2867 family)
MTKTALVIGATGLIGRALVSQLLAEKDVGKVIALTRRPLDIQHKKLINPCFDFSKLALQQDYFQNVDIFFSCLGTTKKQAGSIAEQRKVDLDYQYLAAKLARQAEIPHYLLVSSSGANADSLSPYLKMKGELEDKIIALHFSRTSIFQPSLLLGKREANRFAEGLGARFLPLLGYLPYVKRYRPIAGEQVAAKMLQLALMNKSVTEQVGSHTSDVEYLVLDEIF